MAIVFTVTSPWTATAQATLNLTPMLLESYQ